MGNSRSAEALKHATGTSFLCTGEEAKAQRSKAPGERIAPESNNGCGLPPGDVIIR